MTRHLRPYLLRLLVALLIVQGVAAPAWCLERMAPGAGTPICTADGLRFQHDGDNAPAPHHGNDGCVVCHALPQGPVPDAPVLADRAMAPVAMVPPPPVVVALPQGARGSAYAARAPPVA
jgi:hypothetical protein